MKAPLTLILIFSFFVFAQAQTEDLANKKWTLEDCVNYALENNIQVKQSENNIALAEVDKRQAVGKGPALWLFADGHRNWARWP